MLDALVTPEYLANETPGWEGILKHGVYHKRNLGVDESVMWGEFFSSKRSAASCSPLIDGFDSWSWIELKLL